MEKKKAKESKKKADKPKEHLKELTDSLQVLQAEFENYKKRTEKEKQEFVKYAKGELVRNLLPVLDSFEHALKDKDKKEEFIKGVEQIFAQFYSILEQEGLRPIDASGKMFDPYKHDALLQEKSDKEDGTVLEELQKGYMLNDKMIRPTKVKVSKNER
ncbi:nucleotide exchange factor GrpE [Candidatus Woesearchaeota archaeon]|nr:nucleotide exchange factor GrpE [Candidatus Woesearchaeota archaeon]|tara:strand:+ start:5143 stop:5616 length:474 start_codon:yes stop_codon:yes gene_type:complete